MFTRVKGDELDSLSRWFRDFQHNAVEADRRRKEEIVRLEVRVAMLERLAQDLGYTVEPEELRLARWERK